MPHTHRGDPVGGNHANRRWEQAGAMGGMTRAQYGYRQNINNVVAGWQHLADTGQDDELRKIGGVLDRSTTATSLHRQGDPYSAVGKLGWDKRRFLTANEMASKVHADDPYQHISMSDDVEYLNKDFGRND